MAIPLPAFRPDRLDHRVGFADHIVNRNVRAGARQGDRAGLADAGIGAGHQRFLPDQQLGKFL